MYYSSIACTIPIIKATTTMIPKTPRISMIIQLQPPSTILPVRISLALPKRPEKYPSMSRNINTTKQTIATKMMIPRIKCPMISKSYPQFKVLATTALSDPDFLLLALRWTNSRQVTTD